MKWLNKKAIIPIDRLLFYWNILMWWLIPKVLSFSCMDFCLYYGESICLPNQMYVLYNKYHISMILLYIHRISSQWFFGLISERGRARTSDPLLKRHITVSKYCEILQFLKDICTEFRCCRSSLRSKYGQFF